MSDVKHNDMGPVKDVKWSVNVEELKVGTEGTGSAHPHHRFTVDDVDPEQENVKAVKKAVKIFWDVHENVVERLKQLRHDDKVHNLHETDQLHMITMYKLHQYAVEEVAYGFNYFGKVEVEKGKFIHVRAHSYHDAEKPTDFYSLLTEPEAAVWPESKPLEYFID